MAKRRQHKFGGALHVRDTVANVNAAIVDGSMSSNDEYETLVLQLAREANITDMVYTVNNLTSVTYADYKGVTSHTKTLSYTLNNLTQTIEAFSYRSESWTVTTDFGYVGNDLDTRTQNIVRT